MKKIFQYQLWHLLAVLALVAAMRMLLGDVPGMLVGDLWGSSTRLWFWVAVCVPIVHQGYVWLIWRLMNRCAT